MVEKKEVEAAREASVQSRATDDTSLLGRNVVLVLSRAGQLISPWWSRSRDMELRRFWKQVDHLAGAIYTFESRLSTIPFQIVPKDATIRAHWRLAEEFHNLLLEEAEFGEGWNSFYEPWVEDLITQDNGAFAEVIGDGDVDGPIVGMPLGVAHLDSSLCTRTGHPEFPVLYQDPKGDLHKMHFTRVIYAAQMQSPFEQMHKVGFCAVSRCINIAQNLLDIMTYKQEKLGSRPARGLMITQGGLDPDDIREGMALANEMQDNQNLTRYSRTAVVGHADMPDSDVKVVDLSSMPDGFDEKESVSLGMATIALALGVDARELFPGMQAAATRADALISHIKQRGKGLGQVLQLTERRFNAKFLPDTLTMVFDFQDDAQDAQRSEIRLRRSERHKIDLNENILDERAVREQMVADGDLSKEQFERLEMQDGRLPDGDPIFTLFFRPDTAPELDMGVNNPLDIKNNDPIVMLDAIAEKRQAFLIEGTAASPNRKSIIKLMLGALDDLEKMYGGLSAQMATIPRSPPVVEDEQVAEDVTEEEGVQSDIEPDDLDLDLDEKSNGRRPVRELIGQAADKIIQAAARTNGESR